MHVSPFINHHAKDLRRPKAEGSIKPVRRKQSKCQLIAFCISLVLLVQT